MDRNLVYAKELLEKENFTCVLWNGEHLYTSRERGVKPLLEWLDQGLDLTSFSAADKVVGKAAAFLYVLLGVSRVYASVISEAAEATLLKVQIPTSYDKKTKEIINRSGTGLCPMEQATLAIESPEEALLAIKETLKRLSH